MIQTVKGAIKPEEMGITMSHEHLCVDLSRVRLNDDSTFGYSDLVVNEINSAKQLGVKTFVEVSCNDMGRNVEQLVQLSDACNVNIIESTGFYLDEYHPDEVRNATVEEIAEIFVRDLTEGIDGTSIKAGVIGEVASSKVMTESERRVLMASAIAAKKVGCAVTTHCQNGLLGKEQASIFLQAGMDPKKVILGHIDLSDDIDYMCELLDLGFNIAFDTIGKVSYLSDEKRAENLKYLIENGYSNQIVLSQDISRKSYFSNNPNYYGYTTVMKQFVPRLKTLGVKEEDINKMLISNPQRIFNISI